MPGNPERSVPSRVEELFLSYVVINTQADPTVSTSPSSPGQFELGALLVKQLLEFGIAGAHQDEFGCVYATIKGNAAHKVPPICLCAHLDTSPECSGAGVKPIVHRNYGGQDIIFPDDPTVILRFDENPDLASQIGNDLITASGTTLLGSDDKSGVTAIMDLAYYLTQDPNPPQHGDIKILFTPDEEIGRGTNHVDMEKLGAQFGYTLDGGKVGSLDIENFTAHSATITITGVPTHPGYAKDKMQNAIKIAARIAALFPDDLSPETSDGRQGFIYIFGIQGGLEKATINLMLRDYSDDKLKALQDIVKLTVDRVMKSHPSAKAETIFKEQYRNMKEVLDLHPTVVEYARQAIKEAGCTVYEKPIRGGTDGARFCFMGMPCPNIFAGEHLFHSVREWTSVQDMEKASKTLANLCRIWCEASAN